MKRVTEKSAVLCVEMQEHEQQQHHAVIDVAIICGWEQIYWVGDILQNIIF